VLDHKNKSIKQNSPKNTAEQERAMIPLQLVWYKNNTSFKHNSHVLHTGGFTVSPKNRKGTNLEYKPSSSYTVRSLS